MPKVGRDQNERRLTIREGAHHPSSAPEMLDHRRLELSNGSVRSFSPN
jgi:hypothetical protein